MKDKLVIIGAGVHAKVVADILLQNNEYEVVGLVDNWDKKGFLGLKIIGDDNSLEELFKSGVRHAIIAVGNNGVRERLFNEASRIGYHIINAISEYAVLSDHIKLGNGIVIMPGAIINVDSIIGNGCIINTNASIDHDGKIGEFVHVAPGSALAGSVTLGKGTFCGVGCRIIDGVKVGSNVIIGAGTVVISEVESDCTIVGVPAKYIKRKEEN